MATSSRKRVVTRKQKRTKSPSRDKSVASILRTEVGKPVTPGEILLASGDIEAFPDRETRQLMVTNSGDRPIQVGSHCHFFEVNRALQFDREQAFGFKLCIPAGTAARFEPGEEKRVTLVAFGGKRVVHGINNLTDGPLDDTQAKAQALTRATEGGFIRKGGTR